MNELSDQTDYNPRSYDQGRASAARVYARLVSYAWKYKGRLFVSLLFAMVVAVSFGSMLMATGAAVQLIFGAETEVQEQTEEFSAGLGAFSESLRNAIGWAPEGLDRQFRDIVGRMREHRMTALWYLSAALVALTFLSGIARFVQEYFAGSISAGICVDLIQAMYENVMNMSLPFFEKRSTGELVARFTNDAFMINRGLTGVFVKLLREPFKALVFLVIALHVDVLLTFVGLCVLPLVAYVIVRLGKKVRKNVRRSLERVASFASVAKESFSGIMIVKGFCMEPHRIQRAGDELTGLRRYLRKMYKADAAVGPLSEFVMVLGVVAFLLLSGKRFEAGLINAGGLARLFGALALMLDPLRKLTAVNTAIQQSVASAERVFEFVDARPSLVEAPDAVELPRLSDSLRFENVQFSYPGHDAEVLSGIDLEVRRGQMVALVGFSGAGKTTIAKLVPRFYDPTSGRVTLDGIDLRSGTLRSLRGQIGIVTQDTVLFDDTVRNNITAGSRDCSDDRVRDAARMAQAHEFIENLPAGYDTRIGEAGGSLSGGQRQRLAIARALAKDPAILIMDEATSSLDSESERAIQKAIEQSIVGRTTIVIAHRLSTILRADRIFVIEKGRIVESGTHGELIEADGLYRRLYEVQFADGETTERGGQPEQGG